MIILPLELQREVLKFLGTEYVCIMDYPKIVWNESNSYFLLQDSYYDVPFSEQLLFRCLQEQSIHRLKNLSKLAGAQKCLSSVHISIRSSYSPVILQWIYENNIEVNQDFLINVLLMSTDETKIDIYFKLLKVKIPLQKLVYAKSLVTLKGVIKRKAYIKTNRELICLDELSASMIEYLFLFAPVPFTCYTYENTIDYAETPRLLELLYTHLYNFLYTETAVRFAIQDNNIEVLEWWSRKEQEGALVLKIPQFVHVTDSILPEVSCWAELYDIRLYING
jgi:hypothetical protein